MAISKQLYLYSLSIKTANVIRTKITNKETLEQFMKANY